MKTNRRKDTFYVILEIFINYSKINTQRIILVKY